MAQKPKTLLDQVRAVVLEAMESRRDLVAFNRMDALEMDRHARKVERDALERLRGLLPSDGSDAELQQARTRLARMDEALETLAARTDIGDRSRALEQDDITWRTFEDVAWLLGIR
jgi:hypothetical protein